MKRTIEMKGETVELAIEKGLLALETSKEKVEVEIIQKEGFLKKARILMTTIETPDDIAQEFVQGVLNKMGISATATATMKGECVHVDIEGKDSGSAIGYRGETLDAIQYLTLTIVNHDDKNKFVKVVVNAENYREKREETLIALASRLANKAYRQGRKVVLEPMNPFERRIIHSALHDSEIASTTSEGEEPNRHVVIIPKGEAPKREFKPNDDRKPYSRDEKRPYNKDGRKPYGRDGRKPYSKDGSFDSRKPREEKNDNYDDYDNIVGRKIEKIETPVFSKEQKNEPPKFKSFGGKKGLPF